MAETRDIEFETFAISGPDLDAARPELARLRNELGQARRSGDEDAERDVLKAVGDLIERLARPRPGFDHVEVTVVEIDEVIARIESGQTPDFVPPEWQ
jgi:hypothetical protein